MNLGGQNSVHNIVSFHSSLNIIFIVDYSMILTMRINISLLWAPITRYKYLCLELTSLLFFFGYGNLLPGCSLPLVLLSFYLSQFVNLSKWTYKNAHGTMLLLSFNLINEFVNISGTLWDEFKFFTPAYVIKLIFEISYHPSPCSHTVPLAPLLFKMSWP